jgi:hypothetical protein
MELNDLKSNWQNAGGTSKSESDLQKMTKIAGSSAMQRLRKKLVIESIALLMFSLVYYDWFDGDKKPVYANVLLLSGVLLYILNDVIGYIAISNPISGLNLKLSIQNYLQRVRHLFMFSLIISVLYGISLLVFFSSVIHFTKEKGLLLAGLIATLSLMYFLSFRIWNSWLTNLRRQAKDFESE